MPTTIALDPPIRQYPMPGKSYLLTLSCPNRRSIVARVTADLDEDPIIERRVLARAVSFHLAGRALANGSKTVVSRD